MKNARRKRLCIMIPGHWSQIMGGSQYQAKCLIEELRKMDRYDIFYLTRGCDPNYTPDGYRLIHYGYPGAGMRGSHRHLFELILLPRLLKRIDPDVIYQRVGCAQTGIAARYALKNRCRMIWHIAHEHDLEPPRISASRLFVYKQLDRYVLNYGIKHASHIIAQTWDQRRLLERNFGRKASVVIPNFHPAPTEVISKNKPVQVVWVANLKPLKQPEIFMRLAAELQHLNRARFLMVGAIQGNTIQKRKYMEFMNSVPGLTYLGPRSQKEVNELLAESHIFVNTSDREGFPNTFIQAWFRRVPVVSLTVNPDRLIERYRLGFVSGSFERLKTDVASLIEDDDLRSRLGMNAQSFALEYFSTRNADKIVRLFEQVP
ncbi:glycosyltransferase family 4 protein [Desulfococcus multivorans]|uniref:glycosyltransferase family 4 protein n=1 Tax=Desulfococcus multivorans TaxID=897 RepID=UPI0009909481|nr:glycosyltransferase [Desulfococcus multivorans]AQV02150.1 hypothetical protein B2D07_16200 [Desulfococcus multivorans]